MPAVKKKRLKMTAVQVIESLRKLHAGEAWGFFTEMGNTVGYQKSRSFDAFAIAYWASLKHERRVYEVKVSRSDFKHELANPEKRQAALKNSNTFYFATPKGLIELDELPPEAGLFEIDEDGRARLAKKAPWRESEIPSWGFIHEIARRASRAEAALEVAAAERRKHSMLRDPFHELAYAIGAFAKNGGFYECNTCNPEPEYDKSWWQLNYFARRAKEKGLREESDRRWRVRYYREKIEELLKKLHEKGAKI